MALKVSLNGLYKEDAQFTFNVSGTIVNTDVGVKAVSLDSSAANTVKLAADGDQILGRLETYENRTTEGIKVGTVNTDGGMAFLIGTGKTVVVGSYLLGDGAGFVKATTAPAISPWLVVEIIENGTNDIAVAIKV